MIFYSTFLKISENKTNISLLSLSLLFEDRMTAEEITLISKFIIGKCEVVILELITFLSTNRLKIIYEF